MIIMGAVTYLVELALLVCWFHNKSLVFKHSMSVSFNIETSSAGAKISDGPHKGGP